MTIAEVNKMYNNQDFALKRRVLNEGTKIGTKWNFDALENDDLYELDGKMYQINWFMGIVDVKEVEA